MKVVSRWPKRPYTWIEGRVLYVSLTFTWQAPHVRARIKNRNFDDRVVIGGPGAYLIEHFYPDFWEGLPVSVGRDMPGILQKINPLVTRTTYSCIRACPFCALGRGLVEPGGFAELDDWPDLPINVDNNLLAASQSHFDRVIDRLIPHGWVDFDQGLDARLMTSYHAKRIAELARPMVRLALDSTNYREAWVKALEQLLDAGVAKYNIRSYAMIAYDSGPEEAWERCRFIETFGIKALPMWYHSLDALEHNVVTDRQREMGWCDYDRRRIMQWYYHHKEAVKG